MGDGEAREGSAVPYGLHHGIRLPDFSERGRTGPEAQLQPSHGHRVPVRRLPNVTLTLPQVKDAHLATTARTSDKDAGRQDLLRVAAHRSKAGQTGSAPQLVDIGRDVETR